MDELDVVGRVKAYVALLELARRDAAFAKDAERLLVVAVARGEGRLAERIVHLGLGAHGELEVKRGGRLAQAGAEHTVHVGEHGLAGGGDARLVLARGDEAAKLHGVSPQHAAERGVHLRGVLGARGLGHGGLGHDAPLGHEVGREGELAAILLGRAPLEQVLDGAVVPGEVGRGDHVVEKGVGLLELVVEHAEGLRELEVLDVEVLHGVGAQHVERGVHPATAGVALVGDSLGALEAHTERVRVGAHGHRVASRLVDAHRRGGVAGHGVGAVRPERPRKLVNRRMPKHRAGNPIPRLLCHM